jgi:excisionase family DNA binding protein
MDKLAFGISEAAEKSNTSRSQLYCEISSGRLAARKRGKRTLILREDLESWLRGLPQAKADTTTA